MYNDENLTIFKNVRKAQTANLMTFRREREASTIKCELALTANKIIIYN